MGHDNENYGMQEEAGYSRQAIAIRDPGPQEPAGESKHERTCEEHEKDNMNNHLLFAYKISKR